VGQDLPVVRGEAGGAVLGRGTRRRRVRSRTRLWFDSGGNRGRWAPQVERAKGSGFDRVASASARGGIRGPPQVPRTSARSSRTRASRASAIPGARDPADARGTVECESGSSPAHPASDLRDLEHRVVPDGAISMQTRHLHLIVEARDSGAPSRGMHDLTIRTAGALNRLWIRRGRVFDDHDPSRVLRTPCEVRNAIVYVLANAREHACAYGASDPFSSAAGFEAERRMRAWPDLGSPTCGSGLRSSLTPSSFCPRAAHVAAARELEASRLDRSGLATLLLPRERIAMASLAFDSGGNRARSGREKKSGRQGTRRLVLLQEIANAMRTGSSAAEGSEASSLARSP
jgi:hypothetical protein